MAGPWEQYSESPTSGPWAQYSGVSADEAPAASDQFFGPTIQLGSVRFNPMRNLAMAGGAIAQGAAGTIGLPGELESFLRDKFPSQMSAIGDASGTEQVFPTVKETSDYVNSLAPMVGAPGGAALQPQDLPEHTLSGGFHGLGASLPLVPFLGPGVIAPGFTGGVGSELASEATGGNPLATFVGGVIGGGISPSFAGRSAAALEDAQAELAVARAARIDNIAAAQTKAEQTAMDIAKKHGTPGDFAGAGAALQQGARDWLANAPKIEAQVWQPVEKTLPANASAPVTPLLAQLTDMTAKGGPQAAAAVQARGLMPKELRDAVASEALGEDGSASWGAWKQFYDNTQDAMRKPGNGDVAMALQDLHHTTIGQMGSMVPNEAFPDFAGALAHSANTTDLSTNVIPKIIAGVAPTSADLAPGALAHNVALSMRQGPEQFNRLAQLVPSSAGDIAATILHPQDEAAFAGASGLRGWGKLSDASKQALVPDQAHREALDSALTNYTGAAANESNKIAGLQQTVADLSAKSPASPGESNELLRVLAFENLANLASGIPGVSPSITTAAAALRAGVPLAKRFANKAARNPGSMVAGALAGSDNALMPKGQ